MLSPDPQTFEAGGQGPPQVFTRVFPVPAGLPWVQAKAAALEARHGAPLPMTELMHQVRRVGGWSPGQATRFVAFYLRVSAYSGPFETSTEVDGQQIKVAFGAGRRQVAQVRDLALLAGAIGSALALLVVGVSLALQARSAADDELSVAERQIAAKTHALTALRRQVELSSALRKAVGPARPMSEVISDLGWASSHRAEDARIVAVHWDHGLLAVEVRGDAAPFGVADRGVERAPKPIRTGVWLWGVKPRGAPGASEVGP